MSRHRGIGFSSLVTVIGAAVLGTIALAIGACDISNRAPSAAVLIGLFAMIACLPFHRLGSHVADGLGVTIASGRLLLGRQAELGGEPRELPRPVLRGLTMLAFVFLGLMAFGNRAPGQLASAASAIATDSGRCPPPGSLAAVPPPPLEPARPARGCALVRRAFELGYAKSLGECAPKLVAASVAELVVKPCQGRAHDEPAFHYGARLLKARLADARTIVGGFSAADSARDFRIKLDHFGALASVPSQAILGTPRAAHHIWTNAKEPPPTAGWLKRVRGRECSIAAASRPPTLSWTGANPSSQLLSNAVEQLVISSRFGQAPLRCGDVKIHWDAPIDSCARLESDAESTLSAADADSETRGVFSRHSGMVGRAQLAQKLALETPDEGDEQPASDAVPVKSLQAVVSFSCLMFDKRASLPAKLVHRDVALWGKRLASAELVVPPIKAEGAAQLEIYQALSQVLSGARFRPDVTGHIEPIEPGDVLAKGLGLLRLEFLTHSQPFLGEGWPLEETSLREVYPLEAQLGRLVLWFRKRFRQKRYRL